MKMLKKIPVILAMSLAALLAFQGVTLKSMASQETVQAVRDARNGILQVNVVYVDDNGVSHFIKGGGGFLVGESTGAQTVITNYHVVTLNDEEFEGAMNHYGTDKIKNQLKIEVVVKRDMVIGAEIKNESAQADFAILTLEQPIYDRVPLKLAHSSDVSETEDVYALGFPGVLTWAQADTFYTGDDVNISKGTVSKKTMLEVNKLNYIQHGAILTEGNSGGPLVNKEGHVVGLNTYGLGDTYFYSLQSDEIIDALNALGIPFLLAGESDNSGAAETPATEATAVQTQPSVSPQPEETTQAAVNMELFQQLKNKIDELNRLDASLYTEDSYQVLQDAIADAAKILNDTSSTDLSYQDALLSLSQREKGLGEKPKMNLIFLAWIVAVVLLAAIVIIVAVIMGKKKKKRMNNSQTIPTAPMPGNSNLQGSGGRPLVPPGQSTVPSRPNVSMPFQDGTSETTVLNPGIGETTVLSALDQRPAKLLRVKTREQISINKPIFIIGKEKRKVDYCITDNSSISRNHVRIICRNGDYFVIDLASTNYTYVNGSKITPNQEVPLKNNDVIKLSDEEFQFIMA